MLSFDFVKDDCAVGSAVLGKRGYNFSSKQSMVLFHVKAMENSFLSWQKAHQWVFSMVCVMLQAVYTTAEKEFRTMVFLIFGVSCWHKKAPIHHKRWNNMIFHPVHYKGKDLQSRCLFKHSVEACVFKSILQDANRTGFYKVSMSTESIIHVRYII